MNASRLPKPFNNEIWAECVDAMREAAACRRARDNFIVRADEANGTTGQWARRLSGGASEFWPQEHKHTMRELNGEFNSALSHAYSLRPKRAHMATVRRLWQLIDNQEI